MSKGRPGRTRALAAVLLFLAPLRRSSPIAPILSSSLLAPIVSSSLIALALPFTAAHAAVAEPRDAVAADRMLDGPKDPERDRVLLRWAQRAPIADLVYLLRRPANVLGALEAPLADAALARTPPARAALRRRLVARVALADPRRARKLVGDLDPATLRLGRPFASPFRVAVLLPDSGDYASYAHAVRVGLAAGLASMNTAAFPPLTLCGRSGAGDDPAGNAAALAAVLDSADVVVGDLLSVPTLAFATAARLEGFPLISPTATDEAIGGVAPSVFALGPSGWARGEALAHAVLDASPHARVAVYGSNAVERGAFARGFLETATTLGATIVWHDSYAAGTVAFQNASELIGAKKPDVLFWEGETREAEALLRRLAQDHVSVRVCGGDNLAPERFHSETRPLLEGVRYVGDDWRLRGPSRERLDSLVRAGGEEALQGLQVRGYLAARAIARAVHGGALTGEEITAALATRVAREPYLAERRFLDLADEGASLPVWTVVRGRAVLSAP